MKCTEKKAELEEYDPDVTSPTEDEKHKMSVKKGTFMLIRYNKIT